MLEPIENILNSVNSTESIIKMKPIHFEGVCETGKSFLAKTLGSEEKREIIFIDFNQKNKLPRKLKKKLTKKDFLHRFLNPKIYIVGFGKKIKYKKRYKKSSFKNFKKTTLLPFTYNELVEKFGKDVVINMIVRKEIFTVYKTF